ncbi:hypothetical protein HDU98_011722 [Podochytrium sp. JEL0797]|nr:hypothetical protein HDU98_011722 [Podochytrium sp. JEL0797]
MFFMITTFVRDLFKGAIGAVKGKGQALLDLCQTLSHRKRKELFIAILTEGIKKDKLITTFDAVFLMSKHGFLTDSEFCA